MIELTELDVLKHLSNERDSFHATYNGGHHDDGNRRAFHHGMDTVFNGIDARIKFLESQTPATTNESKRERPNRRFHVTIDIQADDMKSLRWVIDRLSLHFHQEQPSNRLISGGYESGYFMTVTERPEQTHDKFVKELNEYLALSESEAGNGNG